MCCRPGGRYTLAVMLGTSWRVCALGWVVSFAPARAFAQEPAPASAPVAEGPAPARGLPGVEVVPLKRARHDWYLGFGAGLGVGNLRTKTDGGTGASGVLIGQLRGGGRVRDNLVAGGLLVSSFGAAVRLQGLLGALGEVIGYPLKGKGLVLSAALGLGVYWQSDLSADAMTQAALASRTGKPGIAFGAGVGHEFWLARRFNLGLVLRADGLGSPAIGLRAAGTLGLTFTWY